jgi:phosphinothricin acetyltransferase
MIREATMKDSPAIAGIYNWYISNSTITFEEDEVEPGDMAQRMVVADQTRPWLVLEIDGEILGFACAGLWRRRSAYRYARETSIYVHEQHFGKGYGRQLYERLLNELRQTDVNVVIAGIALPNERSIELHEKLGFEKVGHFHKVGKKFGKQLDVGYWQLSLEQD